MLERLTERGARVANARAAAKARDIESRLRAELPTGLGCDARGGRIVISGRDLGRRYVTDADLRSLLARLP